jgi:hypothetical protein
MTTSIRIALIGAVAMATASTAFASGHRGQNRDTDGTLPSTVLIRVQKFTGVDANKREQVLYQSDRGVLLPLSHLAVIGHYTNYDQPRVADGAYHSLKIELANEAHIYGAPTGPVHTPLRADGAANVIDIPGTVVVAEGEVIPLGVAFNAEGMTNDHDAYQLAERAHNRTRGNHDDDDDDHDDD